MAEFLYRIEPTRTGMVTEGPTAAEAEVTGRHFQYLKGLAERGVVRLAGRTTGGDERTFGIVILEVADEAQAAAIMREDPAVREGLMRAELYPFRTALGSPSPAAG